MENLYSLDEASLAKLIADWGQPKFRSTQIWRWLYERGVQSFSDMSDLPKQLRALLEQHYQLGELRIVLEQNSDDGTQKRLYKLHDNRLIESVLMPY